MSLESGSHKPRQEKTTRITREEEIAHNFSDEWTNIDQEEFTRQWGNHPEQLFSSTGFAFLRSLPVNKRISYLVTACESIMVGPQQVLAYLREFPEEAEAINMAAPKDSRQLRFFADQQRAWSFGSAALGALDKWGIRNHPDVQLQNTSERREIAPLRMVAPVDEPLDPEKQSPTFYEAWEAYNAAHQQVAHQEHVIAMQEPFTAEAFGEAFSELSPEEQSRFTRAMIANNHYLLLYHETFNSNFTSASVERQAARRRSQGERPESRVEPTRLAALSFDPAHSMIYRTEYLPGTYAIAEEEFDRMMNSTSDVGGDVEEYATHKLLLQCLRAMPDGGSEQERRKNVDLLIDFWDKNRNPIFIHAVIEALSKQDIPYAVTKVLARIREEPTNIEPFTAIIFRLELGRIGVTPKGVRIYGNLYDLGEYNQIADFVERLSVSGEFGVFNGENSLIGVFSVDPETLYTTSENPLLAKVRELTNASLDPHQQQGTKPIPPEVLQSYVEYAHVLADPQTAEILGISPKAFTMREQAALVHASLGLEFEDRAFIAAAIRSYGGALVRTFGVLAGNQKDIRRLSRMSTEADEQTKTNLSEAFAYISRLVTLAQSLEGQQDGFSQELAARLHVLAESSTTELLRSSNSEGIEKFAEIAKRKQKDDLLFVQTVRLLQERCELDFETLEAALLETRTSQDLQKDAATRTEMADLYRKCHAGEPNEYVESLLTGNDREIEEGTSTYYTIRYNQKLVGMIRFDEKRDEDEKLHELYAGGFNVDRDYGNGKLGEALFEISFREMRKLGVPITAHVLRYDPKRQGIENPLVKVYKQWGFIVDELKQDTTKDGQPLYTLVMPPTGFSEVTLTPPALQGVIHEPK